MLFLGVVRSLRGQAVVDSDGIVGTLDKMTFGKVVLVFVLVQDHVFEDCVHHLPASFTNRSCRK